jgi:hypothetical protein
MSLETDFANLTFKLECSNITLTRTGQRPLEFHGPGELWQNENGVLQFKIFVQENCSQITEQLFPIAQQGQIIEPHDFFQLQAISNTGIGNTGTIWHATKILPDYRGGMERGTIYGFVAQLESLPSLPFNTSDHVQFLLKGLLEFPCNATTSTSTYLNDRKIGQFSSFNAAIIKRANYSLEIYPKESHTVINFISIASSFSDLIYLRIWESLQFCLSTQIVPLVINSRINNHHLIRLMSPRNLYGSCRLPPPLLFQHPLGQNVWNIFNSYFTYIQNYSTPQWHPISLQHKDALESSAASLKAEALSLAVAIEGLVKICYSGTDNVPEECLRGIDTALSLIHSSSEIPSDLKSRIVGALNAMKRIRNSDIIRSYVKGHGMSPDIFKAWNKLRNIFVHGENTNELSKEKLLRQRNQIVFLFYSMILTAIGYTGERTDYSTNGWTTIS